MGDRANCIVLQNNFGGQPVWLYTHWGGGELLELVQAAIKKRERWNDDSYLTRIIFDTMSAGQQGETTGFGITTLETDNGHDFVVVDPEKQEVRIEDCEDRTVRLTWSFEDFCAVDVSNVNY